MSIISVAAIFVILDEKSTPNKQFPSKLKIQTRSGNGRRHYTSLCKIKIMTERPIFVLTCFPLTKESCYIFLIRNNCWEFLASYGVIIQSVLQSYLKTPVCGASLSCCNFKYKIMDRNERKFSWVLRSPPLF